MHIVAPRHPAVQYAHDVLDGAVPSCQLMRLAVERHFHDLAHAAEKGLWFDERAAALVCDAFELFPLPDGEHAGEPFRLQPWQAFVEWITFGWKRTDGRRRWLRRLLMVGSGNGKTTQFGVEAGVVAIGDGEPGAEIYFMAVDSDQALIPFNTLAVAIEDSPELAQIFQVFNSTNNHRILGPNRTIIRPLAKESRSIKSEGKRPHWVHSDEVHEYRDRRLHDVMLKKLLKRRQPMISYTTTADDGTPETLYEELYRYSVDVLEGWKSGAWEDDTFLALIYQIDDEDDPFAEDLDETAMLEIVAKANPNLGVSVNTDILIQQWQTGKKLESEKNSFLRYSCNRPATTTVREIKKEEWDACADESLQGDGWDRFDGWPCIGAFDLSTTRDLTGGCLYFFDPEADLHYYRYFAWMPEELLEENGQRDAVDYRTMARLGHLLTTPGAAIDEEVLLWWILQSTNRYQMVQWTFDPWHAKFMINVCQRHDVELVSFKQDIASYGEPVMHFLDEMRSRKMRHDGNPLIRIVATNMVTKASADGARIPSKKASRKRIDPVVAGIMCRGRAIVTPMEPPSSSWDGNVEVWA